MNHRLLWTKNRPGGSALRVIGLFATCVLMFEAPRAAQTPRPAARKNQANPAASDPIKCWWKTDKNAVEVGERFTVTLTCGVGATIVPKMEQLDPGALQLAPFEVLSATRSDDIQAPPWRYFQYEYTVRLLAQDFFGKDVEIPELTVTYNIQSGVAGASAGRDHSYVLPAIPIRITSLVPQKANDIRDATDDSFASAKAHLSHASNEFIAASIFFGFGILMIVFAVVRVVERMREREPGRTKTLSEGVVTRACLHEIGRLESEVARAGWTPERAGSALAVLRIGSAVATGRTVAQAPLDAAVPVREGQLAVRKGLFDRERIVVSAPTTPDAIERFRAASNGHTPNGRASIVDDLGKSLNTFSAMRYGRDGNVQSRDLDRALENGRDALRRLHRTTLWPMRTAEMMAQSVQTIRSTVWTR